MESKRHARSRTGFCILVRKEPHSRNHCNLVSRHELCTKAEWALGKTPRTQGDSVKQMEKTGLVNDTSPYPDLTCCLQLIEILIVVAIMNMRNRKANNKMICF